MQQLELFDWNPKLPEAQIIKLLPYLLARRTGMVGKMNRDVPGDVIKIKFG